jgi:hypothetical protein
MSAETSQIADISGAAASDKKPSPKRPETGPRKPPHRSGPEVVQDIAPGGLNMDVVKYFEESRERVREAFEQASGRFDHVRSAARDTGEVLHDCHSASISGLKELNERAIEQMHTDVDRLFDYGRSLLDVKSLSQILQINGEFLRESFESQLERTRTMGELSANLMKSTFEPLQTGMANVLNQARKRAGS